MKDLQICFLKCLVECLLNCFGKVLSEVLCEVLTELLWKSASRISRWNFLWKVLGWPLGKGLPNFLANVLGELLEEFLWKISCWSALWTAYWITLAKQISNYLVKCFVKSARLNPTGDAWWTACCWSGELLTELLWQSALIFLVKCWLRQVVSIDGKDNAANNSCMLYCMKQAVRIIECSDLRDTRGK